jgi:hypothetical protein
MKYLIKFKQTIQPFYGGYFSVKGIYPPQLSGYMLVIGKPLDKINMKHFQLIFLIFIISCSTPQDKPIVTTDVDTVSEKLEAIHKVDSSPVEQKKHFDLFKFNKLADSLISIIADEHLNFKCTIDTIKKSPARHGYYKYLLASHDAFLINYNFYPGKNRPALRFRITQAIYTDDVSLDKAFSNLRKDADSMYRDTADIAHNFSPGLTKETDYVLKSDKQFFWLNLPCPYSTKSVLSLRKIFTECLHISPIKDSIICWCGQGKCDPAR